MKGRKGLLAAAAVAVLASVIAASASAAPAKSDRTSALSCKSTLKIAFITPLTGDAGFLGTEQLSWAKYAVKTLAKQYGLKIQLLAGDSQLDASLASALAQKYVADKQVVAVLGPSTSGAVAATSQALYAAGIAHISPSATRTSLTDGSRKGYFFRVVPNDDVQGPTVANYIANTLKAKNVYIIDDQEAYSQGLADTVQNALKAKGITTSRDSISQSATDFSSVIAKISSSVNVVYIPWQEAAQAQNFGQQLRAAGKSATLFGSDGTFSEGQFTIAGSYISFFPVKTTSGAVAAYKKQHGGKGDYFGAPSAAAAGIVMEAIAKACADNRITRDEVRRDIATAVIPTAQSVLGLIVHFTPNGDLKGGSFGIWKINSDGSYSSVG